MPIDIQDRIANLRLKIAEQEREIALLEASCQALRADLADFEVRYNQRIKPLIEQIDAVKNALDRLRDLLFKQQMGEQHTLESLWRGKASPEAERYIPPHERQFAIPEPIEAPRPKSQSIKQVYRKLARLYHPDLAQGEEDREQRTKIMALINNAYQSGDADLLYTLDETVTDSQAPRFDSQMSLAMLQLHGLQQQYHDLAVQIRDLREKQHDLRYGHMMELKLEESLAQARGENFLDDLIDDLQTEYWAYMRELDALRQQVR
ncbi:MAG: DnaJ domain-containing protein [Anaerolineae bacterium]